MKKLLFFCCLALCLFAGAQSNDTLKYTPVNSYGYAYKRLKVDSTLILALGDTASKAPRQVKFVGNNIFYSDNTGAWHALVAGGSGGGGISNIYTRGDSLFYTLSGIEYFINAYLSKDSADTRYYSVTNPAGYLTSTDIAGKVNYTDTALMLSPYLRAALAASTYYPLSNPNGYITGGTIAGKVNYTDTASMLNPYLRAADGVKYTDTAAMLSPYYRTSNPSGYITGSAITGKVNYTDTAGMLSPYYRASNPFGYITASAISGKVNYTDTAAMLSPYYRASNPSGYITAGAISNKVNYTDTASMLSPYLRNAAASSTYYPLAGNPLNFYKPSDTSATISTIANARRIADSAASAAVGLPSQTGQSGNYLFTNGVTPSWQPVSNPKYLGSIYNRNSWSTVGDFTANNLTAAISSGKITLTYAGSGYSTLDYNYYSQLEHWSNTGKFKATSTSAAMGVGVRAGATAMSIAYVDFSTGYLYIKSTGASGATVDLQAASAGHLTVTANDYILVTIERDVDMVTATARDITANSGLITASFQWKPDYSNGFTPSTGKYCVVAINGTATLDSLSVGSTELVNPNLMVVTDSKGEYSPTTWKSSWVQQIGGYYNPLVVSVDPGKGIDEVTERLTEIGLINPKNVLLMVGRNNYAGGTNVSMSFSTLQTKYQALVTALQSLNINVIHTDGMYETNTNLAPYAAWIQSTYPSATIDTYFPGSQIGSNNVSADGIHPTQSGNDLVAKTIIQSNLLKNGFNYNDIVRFGAPNADATHEGVVNTINQQLGSGMKTVQELNVLTNIVTLNNPSFGNTVPDGNYLGFTGGWMITNGSGAYLPYIWGINNLHIGVAAGANNNNLTGTGNVIFAANVNTAQSLTSGSSNFIWGNGALNAETTGSNNIVLGNGGAYRQTGGSNNVYVGNGVASNSYLASSAEASHNTFVGENTGAHYQLNGSYNVFLGSNAGGLETATAQNKLAIGGGSSANYGIYGDFNNGTYQIGLHAGTILLKGGMGLEVAGGGFAYSRLASSSGLPAVDGSMYYDTVKHKPYFYNGTTYTPNVISHSFVTPTTGTSVNAVLNNNLIVNPSSSLAALTIALPSASDGDLVYLTFKQAIATISYIPASGSVVNVPTSATQGQQMLLTYDATSGNWY